jgi:hypothetical protein
MNAKERRREARADLKPPPWRGSSLFRTTVPRGPWYPDRYRAEAIAWVASASWPEMYAAYDTAA